MKVTDLEKAKRLCRTIISDIVIYNTSRVEKGFKNDSIFEELEEEIELGRKLFLEKVDTSVINPKIFDKTLVDILFSKHGSKIESPIW